MEDLSQWIAENSDNILLALGLLIMMGVVIFIALYFSKKAVIMRTLQKQPKTAISSLQENQKAKIIGKAKPISEILMAPLSGRRCVYYNVIVEKKTGGKNSHWKDIINDEKEQDFILESYSGEAIVKMKDYKSYFVADKKYKSGHFNDPDLKLQNYLELHKQNSLDFFGFNKTLRYKEAIIEVGESVAVIGLVKFEHSSNYGIETSYSKIPVLQSDAKNQLIISDDPKALIEKQV